jgi:hypothetical protein
MSPPFFLFPFLTENACPSMSEMERNGIKASRCGLSQLFSQVHLSLSLRFSRLVLHRQPARSLGRLRDLQAVGVAPRPDAHPHSAAEVRWACPWRWLCRAGAALSSARAELGARGVGGRHRPAGSAEHDVHVAVGRYKPHLILTSSSPHRHLIRIFFTSSSPHPHISHSSPPHPHLILTILTSSSPHPSMCRRWKVLSYALTSTGRPGFAPLPKRWTPTVCRPHSLPFSHSLLTLPLMPLTV